DTQYEKLVEVSRSLFKSYPRLLPQRIVCDGRMGGFMVEGARSAFGGWSCNPCAPRIGLIAHWAKSGQRPRDFGKQQMWRNRMRLMQQITFVLAMLVIGSPAHTQGFSAEWVDSSARSGTFK